MFCSAILARKASGCVVLLKRYRVSFYRSLDLFMPRKLNTPLLLISDLGARFLDKILHFLYCGVWKPSFGHVGHIQGQAHIEPFQLYPTSLLCHPSRRVEYLQDISCYFLQSNSAITSTLSASIACSKVIKASFVPSWRYLSGCSSAEISALKTSWCSISLTEWRNIIVDHGRFPIRAAMNVSYSSLCTPTVRYMVNWRPFTMVWRYSHPTVWCFLFMLLPVIWTISNCASWVIFLVAAVAASWCTNWSLRSCCVPMSDLFDKAPANWLHLDPLTPGWRGCVSMIC